MQINSPLLCFLLFQFLRGNCFQLLQLVLLVFMSMFLNNMQLLLPLDVPSSRPGLLLTHMESGDLTPNVVAS